jgi:hypothetical protein
LNYDQTSGDLWNDKASTGVTESVAIADGDHVSIIGLDTGYRVLTR